MVARIAVAMVFHSQNGGLCSGETGRLRWGSVSDFPLLFSKEETQPPSENHPFPNGRAEFRKCAQALDLVLKAFVRT